MIRKLIPNEFDKSTDISLWTVKVLSILITYKKVRTIESVCDFIGQGAWLSLMIVPKSLLSYLSILKGI